MQSSTTPRLYKYIRPLSNRSSSTSCNSIWVLIAIWDNSERVKVYRNTFYPTAPCALLRRQSVCTLASHDLMVAMATSSKRQRWRVAACNCGMFRLQSVVVNCCTLDDAPRTRRTGPVHTDWARIWPPKHSAYATSWFQVARANKRSLPHYLHWRNKRQSVFLDGLYREREKKWVGKAGLSAAGACNLPQ